MKYSIFHLTEREWNQIRAALKFWAEVAGNSRSHPCRHPKVEPMFDLYGPLSIEEIEEILIGTPECLYLSIKDIMKAIGADRGTIQRRIKRLGLEPALVNGSAKLFRADQVIKILETL